MLLRTIVVLVGVGCVLAGVAIVYPPAALIVGGAWLYYEGVTG